MVKSKNITMTLDHDSHEAVGMMPRKFSASRVLRHVLKAFAYDDAKWSVYAKTVECKEMREVMRPIKKRFGI